MNDNALRHVAPPIGGLRVLIVLLTFIALCIAFFAGGVHQSDSIADSHDATAAIAEISAVDASGAEPTSDIAQDSDGWMTALVSACALFVLLTIARVFRIRIGGLRWLVELRAQVTHSGLPDLASAATPTPALATLSISRT